MKMLRTWLCLGTVVACLHGCVFPGTSTEDVASVALTLDPEVPNAAPQVFDVMVGPGLEDPFVSVQAYLRVPGLTNAAGACDELAGLGPFQVRMTLEDMGTGEVWERLLEPEDCRLWWVSAELDCGAETGCAGRFQVLIGTEGLGGALPVRLDFRAVSYLEGARDPRLIEVAPAAP